MNLSELLQSSHDLATLRGLALILSPELNATLEAVQAALPPCTFGVQSMPLTDEETFLTLSTAEGLVQDDQLITGGHGWALDPISTITEGGTHDEQSGAITPATSIPGYHVNTLGIAPVAWDEFRIVVSTPYQAFLGVPEAST